MRKNIFLILFIYSSSFSSIIFSQTKIDSLEKIVNSPGGSVEQLDAALELTHSLLRTGNSKAKKYLDLSRKLLIKFPDSIKIAKLDKDFANYFVNTGEYKKAAKYFLAAIKIADNIGDTNLKNSVLNGLAQLNIRTKNYKKGITIFHKLLEDAKNKNNESDVIFYSLNLAMAYGEAGNFDASEKFLIAIYNSNTKNKFYKAVASNSLSFIFNNKKNYTKALKYGKEAVEFSKNISDVAFKIESMTNYSNALKGMGKNIRAGKIISKIILLARKNNFVRKMNNAIGNLALNYESMGDYKSAFKYYKEFSERRDSLLNKSTNAKVNELQIKYETEKKDKEIEEKTASIKQKNLILIYSIVSGIVFVIISIIIFILYRKKNAAYKEIVRKNLKILEQENTGIKSQKKLKKLESDKYESSSLNDEKKEELRRNLEVIINEDKIFLQQNISLGKLAQKLDSNSKYLSQVIHEFYDASFSDFVNEHRINEAAKLLSDSSYSHISIEGISELVGFHTKSSFNTYFKKFMGVTPSFFSRTSAEIKSN